MTTYHIISTTTGYYVAELRLDQFLHLLHSNPMASSEAAERLRDDLVNGHCPMDLTPSPSDSFDPGEHAARCYDVAARIVPLLPKSLDVWGLALRIADAKPWAMPPTYHDFDSQIPF